MADVIDFRKKLEESKNKNRKSKLHGKKTIGEPVSSIHSPDKVTKSIFSLSQDEELIPALLASEGFDDISSLDPEDLRFLDQMERELYERVGFENENLTGSGKFRTAFFKRKIRGRPNQEVPLSITYMITKPIPKHFPFYEEAFNRQENILHRNANLTARLRGTKRVPKEHIRKILEKTVQRTGQLPPFLNVLSISDVTEHDTPIDLSRLLFGPDISEMSVPGKSLGENPKLQLKTAVSQIIKKESPFRRPYYVVFMDLKNRPPLKGLSHMSSAPSVLKSARKGVLKALLRGIPLAGIGSVIGGIGSLKTINDTYGRLKRKGLL